MMQRPSALRIIGLAGFSLALYALAITCLCAQPPDLPDLPADLTPPKFDLGTSAEAQAEQAKTQDQPTVVRTPKPVDPKRLVGNLSLLALSLCIGFAIGAKVRIGFHPQFLSGASAIAGITIVGALLTGTKIADGTSKAHPILLAALGCAAILLATMSVAGGLFTTQRQLGEPKRVDS
jgi:NAD/NADP transhydrogenase alpha subunit